MLAQSIQAAQDGWQERWSDVAEEGWFIEEDFVEWQVSLGCTQQKILDIEVGRCNVLELPKHAATYPGCTTA